MRMMLLGMSSCYSTVFALLFLLRVLRLFRLLGRLRLWRLLDWFRFRLGFDLNENEHGDDEQD